jgi:hypothetical protein
MVPDTGAAPESKGRVRDAPAAFTAPTRPEPGGGRSYFFIDGGFPSPYLGSDEIVRLAYCRIRGRPLRRHTPYVFNAILVHMLGAGEGKRSIGMNAGPNAGATRRSAVISPGARHAAGPCCTARRRPAGETRGKTRWKTARIGIDPQEPGRTPDAGLSSVKTPQGLMKPRLVKKRLGLPGHAGLDGPWGPGRPRPDDDGLEAAAGVGAPVRPARRTWNRGRSPT